MACLESCGSADGSTSRQGMSLLCEPHSQMFFTRQKGEREEDDLDKLKA